MPELQLLDELARAVAFETANLLAGAAADFDGVGIMRVVGLGDEVERLEGAQFRDCRLAIVVGHTGHLCVKAGDRALVPAHRISGREASSAPRRSGRTG
jgi:hypothetical protein